MPVFLLLFSVLAALWDFCLLRIPNIILYIFCFGGFVFVPDIGYFLRIIMTALALYPLHRHRMMGAGDIKLLSMTAGLVGMTNWLFVFFMTAAAGAIWGVVRLVRRGGLKKRFKKLQMYINSAVSTWEPVPYISDGDREAGAIVPLGVTHLAAVAMMVFSGALAS